MKKKGMHFYHSYGEDGRCKVICMYCYATLGTGRGREAIAKIEAAHDCGEWVSASQRNSSGVTTEAVPRARDLSALPFLERVLMRVHPAILLPALAILLYLIPTTLEIAARSHVNTWLAIILPGDAVGCAVLIVVARMPRIGVLLYCVLTACESYWHVTHVMRGMLMAWVVDLIPTVVVIGIFLIRRQELHGMVEAALS